MSSFSSQMTSLPHAWRSLKNTRERQGSSKDSGNANRKEKNKTKAEILQEIKNKKAKDREEEKEKRRQKKEELDVKLQEMERRLAVYVDRIDSRRKVRSSGQNVHSGGKKRKETDGASDAKRRKLQSSDSSSSAESSDASADETESNPVVDKADSSDEPESSREDAPSAYHFHLLTQSDSHSSSPSSTFAPVVLPSKDVQKLSDSLYERKDKQARCMSHRYVGVEMEKAIVDLLFNSAAIKLPRIFNGMAVTLVRSTPDKDGLYLARLDKSFSRDSLICAISNRTVSAWELTRCAFDIGVDLSSPVRFVYASANISHNTVRKRVIKRALELRTTNPLYLSAPALPAARESSFWTCSNLILYAHMYDVDLSDSVEFVGYKARAKRPVVDSPEELLLALTNPNFVPQSQRDASRKLHETIRSAQNRVPALSLDENPVIIPRLSCSVNLPSVETLMGSSTPRASLLTTLETKRNVVSDWQGSTADLSWFHKFKIKVLRVIKADTPFETLFQALSRWTHLSRADVLAFFTVFPATIDSVTKWCGNINVIDYSYTLSSSAWGSTSGDAINSLARQALLDLPQIPRYTGYFLTDKLPSLSAFSSLREVEEFLSVHADGVKPVFVNLSKNGMTYWTMSVNGQLFNHTWSPTNCTDIAFKELICFEFISGVRECVEVMKKAKKAFSQFHAPQLYLNKSPRDLHVAPVRT